MQAAFFDKMPLQPLLLTPLDGASEEKEGITYKTKKNGTIGNGIILVVTGKETDLRGKSCTRFFLKQRNFTKIFVEKFISCALMSL